MTRELEVGGSDRHGNSGSLSRGRLILAAIDPLETLVRNRSKTSISVRRQTGVEPVPSPGENPQHIDAQLEQRHNLHTTSQNNVITERRPLSALSTNRIRTVPVLEAQTDTQKTSDSGKTSRSSRSELRTLHSRFHFNSFSKEDGNNGAQQLHVSSFQQQDKKTGAQQSTKEGNMKHIDRSKVVSGEQGVQSSSPEERFNKNNSTYNERSSFRNDTRNAPSVQGASSVHDALFVPQETETEDDDSLTVIAVHSPPWLGCNDSTSSSSRSTVAPSHNVPALESRTARSHTTPSHQSRGAITAQYSSYLAPTSGGDGGFQSNPSGARPTNTFLSTRDRTAITTRNSSVFNCASCDKTFQTIGGLKSHMQCHKGEY